jgi:uncharacterized protein
VEGGKELIELTKLQLEEIYKAINNLQATVPLAEQIITSPVAVEALHTQLQRHTPYFKSDMSSLLGIQITYPSGDGD